MIAACPAGEYAAVPTTSVQHALYLVRDQLDRLPNPPGFLCVEGGLLKSPRFIVIKLCIDHNTHPHAIFRARKPHRRFFLFNCAQRASGPQPPTDWE